MLVTYAGQCFQTFLLLLPDKSITDAYWHDIDKLSIRIETCSDKEYIVYYEYELEDGKVIEQFNEFKRLGFSIDDEGYGIER